MGLLRAMEQGSPPRLSFAGRWGRWRGRVAIDAAGGAGFCGAVSAGQIAETQAVIMQAGGRALTHLCNISNENAGRACVQACIDALGRLDHLSNMAGILRFDHFHETALADFRRIVAVNLEGTFLMCREAIPHLLRVGGNIVNAASTSSLAGLPWGGAYSASKGAVLAMTRSIAVEYARAGLRANCVCPGDIATPMSKAARMPEGADFSWMARCSSLSGPKGPETVAGVIAMLASEDGMHINGEDIRVDGATLS